MLSINHETVERDITIGELFSKLRIDDDEYVEAKSEFDISILSCALAGEGKCFRRIEGFRKTDKLDTWILQASSGDKTFFLECAHEHLVFTKRFPFWKHAKDVIEGDQIAIDDGTWAIVSVSTSSNNESQRLYDVQVDDTHCFYTNGILSHNSHFLVQMGANAMRQGKNVLHYTFELSEHKVGIRYDANFCGISATDVPDEKDFVKKKYEELKPTLGRLFIKEYPTNTVTVMGLKAHIEKLAITNSFRPDVIIIDYADIMRSSRQFDSLRHELKLVYEELRGLSMELGIPVWTASQSNRGSTDIDVIGLDSISESFGKVMVCDFIVSLSRKPLQKSQGLGNLFIAKNRFGKDGIVFPVRLDAARSIIEVLDKNIDMDEFQKTHENDMKQLLREKWKEVGNERLLELRKVNKAANSGNDGNGEE